MEPVIRLLEAGNIPQAFEELGWHKPRPLYEQYLMDPDYGAAQRLYVLGGYIPGGRGLHWITHFVQFGGMIRVDDDLALYFTKELK